MALTDGAGALQRLVQGAPGVILILDLLHVLQILWKAACVFHAERTLELNFWVPDRTSRILFGEISHVVTGIPHKRNLFAVKPKTLCGVAGYLCRIALMRYDEYLVQGWPIARGSVEGVCKNLNEDRMERSGMRRTG